MTWVLENNGNTEFDSLNASLIKTAGNFSFASTDNRQCKLRTRTAFNPSLKRDRQIKLNKLYQPSSIVCVTGNQSSHRYVCGLSSQRLGRNLNALVCGCDRNTFSD